MSRDRQKPDERALARARAKVSYAREQLETMELIEERLESLSGALAGPVLEALRSARDSAIFEREEFREAAAGMYLAGREQRQEPRTGSGS